MTSQARIDQPGGTRTSMATRKRRRQRFTTFLLIFLCFGEISVIVELMGMGVLVPPLDAAVPARQYQPVMQVKEYTPEPSGLFSEIYERPLFFRSRRPFKTPVKLAQTKSFGFVLVGILINKKQRLALLQGIHSEDVKDNETVKHGLTRVREGQMINGWLIQTIEKKRAILRRGELLEVLDIPRVRHME